MKIYFAGSIRGGRQDAALYGQIVELLKAYGQVLTEHVGEASLAEADLSDRAIYERDLRWLNEADVIVAETTVPSHGVGYEIARAEAGGRPILCLHRPQTGRDLSAMLAGNVAIQCEPYERLDELKTILRTFFRCQSERAERTD